MKEESDHIRDEIFEEIEKLPPAGEFSPAHAERLIALLQAYHETHVRELETETREIADWESEGGSPSTA